MSDLLHHFMIITLDWKWFWVRIILIEDILWISNHSCFHMESAIAKEQNNVFMHSTHWKLRRSASKNFSSTSWFFLWHDNRISLRLEYLLTLKHYCSELNSSHQVDLIFFVWEVQPNCVKPVNYIDLDLNKHIESLSTCLCNWDKATMTCICKTTTKCQ